MNIQENENYVEGEEDLYVSCPVALWNSIVLDNLRKASAASTGEVKNLIDKTLHFCEYCKEDHTY